MGFNSAFKGLNILLRNVHTESLRPGLTIWYDLSNKKGHEIWNV